MMIMDVSFFWQKDELNEDSDAGADTMTQDHGDYDITRPVAILRSVDDPSYSAAEKISVDPYDNDYWIKLPLQ